MTRLLCVVAVAVLALIRVGLAQSPCPSPDLSEHTGAWKPRAGYMGGARFTAPSGSYDRAAAGATLDTILSLLQAAYPVPRGGMAYFEKHLLFSSPDRELPLGYSLYVGHTGFSCTSANRLVESVESGVFVNVDVNSFSTTNLLSIVTAPTIQSEGGAFTVNADDEGNYRVGGRLVYRVPSVHGRDQGVDRYATAWKADRGGAPTEQFVVVRRNDRPLFTHVTRRDYLTQFRGELETYKVRELDGIRANGDYPGGSSAADRAAQSARTLDAYMAAVGAYLERATADELARPVSALMTHFPIDPDRPELRFEDGDYLLVHLNADYLDKALPLHVPQFIVLRWSIKDTPTPATWESRFRDAISGRVDLAALRALLRPAAAVTAPGRAGSRR